MAQTKKSKNSTEKSEKNTSKKTTGTASKKNTKSSNSKQNIKKSAPVSENKFFAQAAPYFLAAAAVLIAVCVILGEGKIGSGIRGILTGLFGGAAYVLPVALLVRTVFWNRDTEEGQNVGRTSCTAIVFVLITMLLHILAGGEPLFDVKIHFSDGKELIGGGVVGGLLGHLIVSGFEKTCSLIIIFAVIFFLSLYIAGVTPREVVVFIAYNIKVAGERRRERKAELEERRKNAPPSKNKQREEEYLAYLREKKEREREAQKLAREEARVGDSETSLGLSGVYRVKRRRQMELDIPVDEPIAEPESENEGMYVQDDPYAEFADEIDSEEVHSELESNEVDSDVVDERIFDEVMRRTRERIEKSRHAEDIRGESAMGESVQINESSAAVKGTVTADNDWMDELVNDDLSTDDDFLPCDRDDFNGADAEIQAGDVLDAVEIASIAMRDRQREAGKAPRKIADDTTDTLQIASSVSDIDSSSEEFDVSKLFANPEDAELLDKLSEAYKQPHEKGSLDIQRSTISRPEPVSVSDRKLSIPEYVFPPIDILAEDLGGGNQNIKDELQDNAVKLVETLRSFNVKTKIENISRGPTITRYELLPEPGTRVRSIVNLVDDIALNLATTGVRIEAPIPGKSAVGIEVPNKNQSTVHLRSLIENDKFVNAKSKLTVCLGEDVAGDAVYFDIAKMPHLLIAGATGMGKSVCINSVITSLLYKASPDEVRLILVDPKKVELSIYNGIPHLLVPVVSDPKKAAGSLSWAVGEMERRFGLIEAVGVRDIKNFNEVTKNDPDYEYMPRIVIIIDELADLMMTAPDDVEESICRLAQKARAAGMHLIIGTQRPSVDVITGLIKANIPSRIAFTVSSQVDSRTIIDRGGAESLIGRGDMLFNPVGAQKPIRVQGAYVSESDVEEVVAYIKNMNSERDNYSDEVANQIEREAQKCGMGKKGAAMVEDGGDGDEDPMLKSAIELAIDSGKISTSLIQRRMSLGYGRAAKLIDRMEQLGYVSAPDGSKPRDVLISKHEYMEMRLKDEAPFDV